ncbi:hypothetical protein VOLCADRAFT_86190 [Volvox carteri f. nagariensis]|uniref:Peptidase M20 dimerisation domain-containing protein n=1 Tax=Volvox carteri f. nagariensis TaxID=3068 RepID=D8TI45_VOLCA|nr:uncharacterized protein VOLCADRAFT_86190 [Volvox carteri f. nagariensis]EFJ52829.1 hypothetical protein VOLCADRAFT_86190 [Volvox carteri f. nagariensis]|eukprot:XP_002945834.1 hypothetical protein VOLCADRAFT_86190 [Volvox carteri f. nagariensis]
MIRLLHVSAVVHFWLLSASHTLSFDPRTKARINGDLPSASKNDGGASRRYSSSSTKARKEEDKQFGIGLEDDKFSQTASENPEIFSEQTCMTAEEASAAVNRFSKLLQFRTVSSPTVQHHVLEPGEFRRLHEWVAGAYPEVWKAMKVEEVGSGNLSFLLTWEGDGGSSSSSSSGRGDSQSSLPVLFLSHLDVVPVANETLANWTYGPFSGAVEGGFVWGRGALDDKVGVSALLEAATLLLRGGWRPQRTVYFAFGHDEEVGGELGAARIADLLAERGVMVDMVYDEGGSIASDGFRPYSSRPLALIGTAEKGFATVNALISVAGGHSSLPPLDGSSAAAVAARLVTFIDRRPPPATLVEPVTTLLAATAPAVRNTAAVTWLYLGFAENVLPPAATVRINFRLLPGSNISTVLEYLRAAAGRDLPHVTFELDGGQNASLATAVTSATSPYFQMLKTALQEVYRLADSTEPLDVAPTLMAGGTDSKHYLSISRGGALRQTPVSLNRTAGDGHRVHGLNERVSVGDFGRAVCVMRRLLQLAGQLPPDSGSKAPAR